MSDDEIKAKDLVDDLDELPEIPDFENQDLEVADNGK